MRGKERDRGRERESVRERIVRGGSVEREREECVRER